MLGQGVDVVKAYFHCRTGIQIQYYLNATLTVPDVYPLAQLK